MKISPRDYDVTIRWSETEQAFLASVAELPGIMADGPTRMEATRQMEEALEFALATAEEPGHPLPRPSRLTAVFKMVERSRKNRAAARLTIYHRAWRSRSTRLRRPEVQPF